MVRVHGAPGGRSSLMTRFSLEGYRKQWPRIGGVLAMALGGATALAAGRMSKPQTLSAVNFGALLVHQYEEYQDPGWFPGQFNRGLFKSDSPRNYPLNTNTGMCINTAIGYPFYIAPIVFPKVRWLGLAPVLFGMAQAVGHGVIFPRIAGDKYSPGFLASALLHVPIGAAYIKAVQADCPLAKAEWAAAIAYTVIFAATGVAGPNVVARDKNSPHAFTAAQMGHYDTQDPARGAGEA
jgi:Protein of unknown function with HXXEE motif